jgi:fructose-1,6-bisphosphatase
LNTITSSVTGAVQAAKPYVHVSSNISSIISSINSISRTVTVTVKYQEVGKPSGTNSKGGNAADPDFFVNNAVGVKNARSSYDALVSEEGPELIQTKDGAYLTG